MKTIKEYADELAVNMLIESVNADISKQTDAIVTAVDGDTEKERKAAEAEQKKYWINLPYKFNIYNEGPKNKNFEQSFTYIKRLIENARHTLYKKSSGSNEPTMSTENEYSDGFAIELPAPAMTYWAVGRDELKKASNNFTKIPSIRDKDYFTGTYNTDQWNRESRGFASLMRYLQPWFKGGKLPCVMKVYDESKDLSRRPPFKLPDNFIVIGIDDKVYNTMRRERVKDLQNTDTLVDWAKDDSAKRLHDEVRRERLAMLDRKESMVMSPISTNRMARARYKIWLSKQDIDTRERERRRYDSHGTYVRGLKYEGD